MSTRFIGPPDPPTPGEHLENRKLDWLYRNLELLRQHFAQPEEAELERKREAMRAAAALFQQRQQVPPSPSAGGMYGLEGFGTGKP